jgi:hypothetical protein
LPHGPDFRVFAMQAPENNQSFSRDPLVGFGASSEVAQGPSRCIEHSVSQEARDAQMNRAPTCSASLEVSIPSALSLLRAAAFLVEHTLLDRQRLQVFTTSWRLHPPRACRLCFMPDPLLGPPSRALFLSRSRTLFPAPFPSWRSNRLQGFSPRESPPLDSAV